MDRLIPHLQKIKFGLHITQAVFIFVAWVLTIVYLRQALIYGPDIGWYFAMCFLSIPAIIYPTLTPMFQRSRRWGHPYAFAAVDVLFTILWLSAFAAVASWNSGAWCIGACSEAEAMVGLGFMVFFFFALTSVISVYGVIYWRQHGELPGAPLRDNRTALIDPDREAFSTANDEYMGVHTSDKDSLHGVDNGAGAGAGAGTELSGEHGQMGYDTSYGGAGVGGYAPPTTYSPPEESRPQYATPAWEGQPVGLGVGTTGSGSGRVQFPAGNY